jgi:hypothetical protein
METKKIIAAMTILMVLTTFTLFASGTQEQSLWQKANRIADNSVGYIPLSRDIETVLSSKDGTLLETYNSNIYSSLVNYGSQIERNITGDRNGVKLADMFYDGTVITPFEDDLFDSEVTYKADVTVDGRECSVYEAKVAFDEALLHYASTYTASGNLIGYDSDDNEVDGSAVITTYIDKETAAMVKEVLEYKLASTNMKIRQEVTYGSKEENGITVIYPITTVTTGVLEEVVGGSSFVDRSYFTITDNASDIVYNSRFKRG